MRHPKIAPDTGLQVQCIPECFPTGQPIYGFAGLQPSIWRHRQHKQAGERLLPACCVEPCLAFKYLRLLAKGLSNKQIARDLEISESTVKSLLSKMQVMNRTEAALNAGKWTEE